MKNNLQKKNYWKMNEHFTSDIKYVQKDKIKNDE